MLQEAAELSARRIEGALFGLSNERIHERAALLVEELGEYALNRPPSQGRVLVQATDDLAAQGADVIAMQMQCLTGKLLTQQMYEEGLEDVEQALSWG